ncbi:hypothetical protein G195_005523 [Phytophthora kernoviae 00238/432]|uniref:Uncharacterized protein n=1 Tax=Phytophthora kernoviae 00238/432 TaxID=1284355 RepID=A0A8J4SCH7_9STRA|nr:hypothetical protein G195_005523 [Phytophthora kernoviae 00238/432]
MHPSLTFQALWPSGAPPMHKKPAMRRDHLSLRSTLARAVFPRVMEFKVISRESDKHEFMPVVYLIDRSAAWHRRVPAMVEKAIVEDYITPLVAKIPDRDTEISRQLTQVHDELLSRANLINEEQLDTNICTDETAYKMGVLVDFTPTPGRPGRAALNRVVNQIATALRSASYSRALVVPVAMHYCSTGSFVGVRRYAGIRYGAPVLLEEREIAIFGEDPTEFTQHFSARLRASLTMQPPTSVAQIEMLRLTRTLHVYCAKVVRDDCFSRRQRASMNEEIMQIHFRTLNHPAMHELKRNMTSYCGTLKHWKLRDEDINSASVLLAVEDVPKHPLHFVWLLAAAIRFVLKLPGRLFLATRSIHDIVARYMSTDLPPPVLQDVSKSAASPTSALLDNDEYTLNAYHKIFINAPRSFPLSFAAKIKHHETARRVVYAPKMLRDETWRNIYETLAPTHLRFRVLLADNKGDNLPMDELLATPFFGAVLSAYVLYQTRSADIDSSTSSSSGDDTVHPTTDDERVQEEIQECRHDEQEADEQALGGYGSVQEIIDAALQMAQDEEELSE